MLGHAASWNLFAETAGAAACTKQTRSNIPGQACNHEASPVVYLPDVFYLAFTTAPFGTGKWGVMSGVTTTLLD